MAQASVLTQGQRRALTILTRLPALVIAPGHRIERHHIAYVTAQALVIRSLVRPLPRVIDDPAHVMGSVVITKAGRAALAQPVEEIPVYLHARDGLTTERQHAAPDEPEVIDTHTLSTWWREQSLLHQAQAEDRRGQARRLARATRRAA